MEDYLITCQVNFVDTETGEVIFQSQFSKPLSVFSSDSSNILKYILSFYRGVRQRKHVALTLTIASDREIPQVLQSQIVF